MEWLSQNWLWIVLGAGALWMFSRNRHGGSMGGCCGGMAHEGPGEARKTQAPDIPPSSPAKEAGAQEAKGAASSHRHSGGCH